ncbi:BLUF domain-containing protein [uncultured Mucilaginibacter sp.]|uniref:BLUF domain-containing protein n=1 Tax=uncultured Mucilaginibacter sp. TaxID=797541 RepID=UPI0025DE57EF|nr:BLUF domain-containing protein [uncultured Mucilaginibacter sp.]
MEYVVYMSTAVRPFTDEELKGLLMQSQNNNKKNNLTGMLLYCEGSFVQLLEGEKQDLEKTYEKIFEDPRHKGIIEIAQGTIDKRNFPKWSMGFNTLSHVDFAQFDAFIEGASVSLFKYGSHPALTILKTFAKSYF